MRTFIALLVFALSTAAATYVVRPGETLGGIASRNGVSVASLAGANGITDPDRIYAGQVLQLPGSTPAAPRIHVIAAGETLGGIARRYGVSVSAIAATNKIANPNRIAVGQRITLPGGGVGPATWVCPVAGATRFNDDFGAPRGGGRTHEGNDLLAPRGTPVVASVSGVLVRHDQPRGGLAYYLRGDDGLTYYGAHLATFVRGDGRVGIGQIIGTVGDTGNAVGGPTHLHFEIINRAGPKNPFAKLSGACPKAAA